MSNSPLIDVYVPAYEGNYTKGRNTSIQKITIHHMAGILSAEQCGGIFQTIGRNGSSNYGIGYDGRIALYVDECNTPWTDDNWQSNCKSVTIETSNEIYGGDWKVSDKALNSLIKLVADIAKRNNLGKLVKGENITWHRMYNPTTICPGDYLLSKMDYICEEANKLNEETKEDYFTPNSSYELIYDKYLRSTPSMGINNNNIVNYYQIDNFSKTICNNVNGKAQLKKGTIIEPLMFFTENNGRMWASYGNCWWCCQNVSGEKQAKKI